MFRRLHRVLLVVYSNLPVRGRRAVVRTIAPTYTVGVMCLIERDDGAVLLVRQAYRGRWGIPGGLLKRREEPGHAARREVLEEVGIDIILMGEPAVVVDATPQRVDIVYRSRMAPGADADDAHPTSPEITEARWFARDALPELQPETSGALVALARATGARLLPE